MHKLNNIFVLFLFIFVSYFLKILIWFFDSFFEDFVEAAEEKWLIKTKFFLNSRIFKKALIISLSLKPNRFIPVSNLIQILFFLERNDLLNFSSKEIL